MAFDTDQTPIRERITVQIQDTTTNSGIETWTDIGCIVNDISLQRQWANDAETGTENRWCDSGEEVARLADYIAGEETITRSILLVVFLSGSACECFEGKRRLSFCLRFVVEDALGPVAALSCVFRVVKMSVCLNM